MKPVKRFQMGKHGLSDEFVEQIKSAFANEEVVKISILRSACRDKVGAKKIADDLIETLGNKYTYKLIGYVLTVKRFRKAQR